MRVPRVRDPGRREELRALAAAHLFDRLGLGFVPAGARRVPGGWAFAFSRHDFFRPVVVTAEVLWGGEAVLSDDAAFVRLDAEIRELVGVAAARRLGESRAFTRPAGAGQTLDPDVTLRAFLTASVVPVRADVAVPARAFRGPRSCVEFVRDVADEISALDVRVVVLRDGAFDVCDERLLDCVAAARTYLYLARGRASDEGVRVRLSAGPAFG